VPPGGLSCESTHLARRGNEVRGVDLMAGPLRPQIPSNRPLEIVIAAAIPQNPAHIRLLDGKQAVAQLAVGRQPQTIAIAAERLRHRCDEADGPRPVAEPVLEAR